MMLLSLSTRTRWSTPSCCWHTSMQQRTSATTVVALLTSTHLSSLHTNIRSYHSLPYPLHRHQYCRTTVLTLSSAHSHHKWLSPSRVPRLCSAFSSFTASVTDSSTSSSLISASSASTTTHVSDAFCSAANRRVSSWLFLLSGLVFGMVVIGGWTRLTRSGLSMVEWKPTQGLPPLTHDQWQQEFVKYQQFPEYQLRQDAMTLNEFQRIYWMEFVHRELGRAIGLVYVLPFAYFVYTKQMNGPLIRRVGLVLVLGGIQAGIGWWMVKSGLDQPHHTPHTQQVHVSPYRLATHLLSAFIIYALLFTTALHVRYPRSHALTVLYATTPALRIAKKACMGTTALVALTIMSGAFVAGNQAGLIYNQFPFMGTGLIPYDDLLSPYLHPVYRNLFEHSTLVQFTHRVLAITSLCVTTAVCVMTRRMPRSVLPPQARQATTWVLVMVWTQVGLGISTLLLYVPIPLASAHQCGSLMLLTLMLMSLHSLGGRKISALPLTAQSIKHRLTQAAAQSKTQPMHA